MTNLRDKAMLVSLTITGWTARKHDRRVSDEVAAKHNTTADVGRYNKVLLAKSALDEITAAANACRTFYYEQTLAWTRAAQMLPSANFFPFTEGMRERRVRWENARDTLIGNYESLVDDAQRRMNGLFNPADYPTLGDLRRKFFFDVAIEPMPDSKDFRVDLSDGEVARIQADIKRRTDDAVAATVKELWQRSHDVVAHMVERLKAYEIDPVSGKVSNPFRDSLVTNLRELVDLMPRLNVTNDPALDAMRARLVASLAGHDPDSLRTQPTVRERVARDAEAILKDMAGYCG